MLKVRPKLIQMLPPVKKEDCLCPGDKGKATSATKVYLTCQLYHPNTPSEGAAGT